MWTASTAPKRYELSIEKSNAKKARSIIAMVLARMLLWRALARLFHAGSSREVNGAGISKRASVGGIPPCLHLRATVPSLF